MFYLLTQASDFSFWNLSQRSCVFVENLYFSSTLWCMWEMCSYRDVSFMRDEEFLLEKQATECFTIFFWSRERRQTMEIVQWKAAHVAID